MIKEVMTPEQAGTDMRLRIGRGEKLALLFGRERWGLNNDEVSLADMIITAPVNPAFASLNIAIADALGTVGWWPPDANRVSLHLLIAHMVAETSRHLGHADIVRELIDGAVGLRPEVSNLPDGDAAWWAAHRDRVERLAREAAGDR